MTTDSRRYSDDFTTHRLLPFTWVCPVVLKFLMINIQSLAPLCPQCLSPHPTFNLKTRYLPWKIRFLPPLLITDYGRHIPLYPAKVGILRGTLCRLLPGQTPSWGLGVHCAAWICISLSSSSFVSSVPLGLGTSFVVCRQLRGFLSSDSNLRGAPSNQLPDVPPNYCFPSVMHFQRKHPNRNIAM